MIDSYIEMSKHQYLQYVNSGYIHQEFEPIMYDGLFSQYNTGYGRVRLTNAGEEYVNNTKDNEAPFKI